MTMAKVWIKIELYLKQCFKLVSKYCKCMTKINNMVQRLSKNKQEYWTSFIKQNETISSDRYLPVILMILEIFFANNFIFFFIKILSVALNRLFIGYAKFFTIFWWKVILPIQFPFCISSFSGQSTFFWWHLALNTNKCCFFKAYVLTELNLISK